MSFEITYDELEEYNAPGHLKMAVDLERYVEELGYGEFKDEIMQFEAELIEASNTREFGNPRQALAAAYRAATGETFEEVASKFELPDHIEVRSRVQDNPHKHGQKLGNVYRNLGFDEME